MFFAIFFLRYCQSILAPSRGFQFVLFFRILVPELIFPRVDENMWYLCISLRCLAEDPGDLDVRFIRVYNTNGTVHV